MEKSRKQSIVFSFEQVVLGDGKRNTLKELLEALFSVLFIFSMIASFCTMFTLHISYTVIAIEVVTLTIVLGTLWNTAGKKALIGKITFSIIPIIGAAAGLYYTKNGIALIGNHILNVLGAYGRHIYTPFEVSCQAEYYQQCATWIFMLLTFWLTLLSLYMVKDHNRMAGILILLLYLLLNLFFGIGFSCLWLLIMAFSLVCILGNCFIAENLTGRFSAKLLGGMFLLLLLIALMTAGFLLAAANPKGYEKAEAVRKVEEKVKTTVAEQRYGKSSERAMPSGDFRHLGNLEFSDKPMLKIEADKLNSLYLRGFTGGEYSENGWKPMDGKTLYKESDLFYWLHEDGFFGQSQIAKAALSLDKKAAKDQISMTIENTGADRRFYYTPYELTELTDGKDVLLDRTVLDDESFVAKGWSGSHRYEVTSLKNQVKRYPSLVMLLSEKKDAAALESYRNEESHYNAFVYDTYTALPKHTQVVLKNHLGERKQKEGGHLGYKRAKETILNYLNKEIKYTTDIETRSQNIDFLENFFDISKSGYSVHYATAAALMFRYYGIPTRYVEGYLITPAAVKEANGNTLMEITDRDAHAWVEYYQDGIGWIPFEVTPPYMNVMEQPESLSSSGAGGAEGENGGQGQSLEMTKDNYEAKEPEKEKKPEEVSWKTIFLGGIAFILLLIAALLLWHLIRRKKQLNALQASFRISDSRQAVINLFDYILELQAALGIKRENLSIYEYKDRVAKVIHPDCADVYRITAVIYQKAAYSQDTVQIKEREFVGKYKEQLLSIIKKQCKLVKRAELRWLKGLY